MGLNYATTSFDKSILKMQEEKSNHNCFRDYIKESKIYIQTPLCKTIFKTLRDKQLDKILLRLNIYKKELLKSRFFLNKQIKNLLKSNKTHFKFLLSDNFHKNPAKVKEISSKIDKINFDPQFLKGRDEKIKKAIIEEKKRAKKRKAIKKKSNIVKPSKKKVIKKEFFKITNKVLFLHYEKIVDIKLKNSSIVTGLLYRIQQNTIILKDVTKGFTFSLKRNNIVGISENLKIKSRKTVNRQKKQFEINTKINTLKKLAKYYNKEVNIKLKKGMNRIGLLIGIYSERIVLKDIFTRSSFSIKIKNIKSISEKHKTESRKSFSKNEKVFKIIIIKPNEVSTYKGYTAIITMKNNSHISVKLKKADSSNVYYYLILDGGQLSSQTPISEIKKIEVYL